jgi:hypothetical protein
MPSTYTSSLRIELQASGENDNSWGDKDNANLRDVIEAAIAGAATIVVGNSDYTLSANFGVPDEARNALLLIQGSQTVQRNLIVPTVTKIYLVRNITSGGFGINVKTAAGAGVVIPNGETRIVFCDGSSVQDGAGATQVGSIKPSSISQTPAPWNWQGVMSLGRSDAVQAGVGRYTADGTSGATYDVYYNSTPMGSFRSVSTGMDINAYNVPLSLSMGGAPMLTVNTAGNVVVSHRDHEHRVACLKRQRVWLLGYAPEAQMGKPAGRVHRSNGACEARHLRTYRHARLAHGRYLRAGLGARVARCG